MRTIYNYFSATLLLLICLGCKPADDPEQNMNNEAQIVKFTVGQDIGIIDQNAGTIEISLKPGTNLRLVRPSVEVSKGATFTPTGTVNLTSPVEYIVTSENKKVTKSYSVTAKVELSGEARITSFTIGSSEGVVDQEKRTIAITIPVGTNIKSITPTLIVSRGAVYSPQGAVDFSVPVEFSVISEDEKNTQTYIVTATSQWKDLTANGVYFSPTGTLRNVAKAGVTGGEANQNKDYDYTRAWSNVKDTLVWIVDVSMAGNLDVKPIMGVPANKAGSKIELIMGSQKQEITLTATAGYTVFEPQAIATFTNLNPGRHTIKLKIKSLTSSGEVAYVKGLQINGSAAKNLQPVILRWRPEAVHTGWANSSSPKNVIMAVHENTIVTRNISAYQPITTPFGYYGSTWDPNSQKFGVLNFSLWSPFDGATPPPTEQFSHLIAVGEGLEISGFNHEGTGVKPKGSNPYDKMVGFNTQVLAVKKIPGNPYDMYYSYYLDMNTRKWKLFGCGKTYNVKPLTYLTTGAFIEQPGPAENERSGHAQRQVNFSGWLLTEDDKWLPIDRMVPQGNITPISYKKWGISSDNKFYMQMGGIDPVQPPKPSSLTITPTPTEKPDYLQGDLLTDLFKLPSTIEMIDASAIGQNEATVSFDIKEIGTNPVVKLYWGTKDGLTFVDSNIGSGGVVKWGKNITLPNKSNGMLTYKLTGLQARTKYYYRLQIKNSGGETWSFDTQTFTTK